MRVYTDGLLFVVWVVAFLLCVGECVFFNFSTNFYDLEKDLVSPKNISSNHLILLYMLLDIQ
eukprot:TRINITY_DN989_c0_g1_i1.p1 TRINITY_DN989_c0_g1~~TRINITY_DN989_c0_g1_i1.p1  ORF type:complete len:62 (+),score=0.24 TRINITY_DN989_c0_g1_i1:228-413(+)